MSPLRILIVDDEAPARVRLREVLTDCSSELPVEVTGEAESGRGALAWLERNEADVAILDVSMPEMDGIALARQIQEMHPRPVIIFSTAFDRHAIDAFEVNATDYLLKPVRKERLLAALRKAQVLVTARLGGETKKERKHLSVTERGKILLIPVTDIVYLRAEQKYVTVKTREREYLSEEALTHLEQELAPHFIRIHRNCIVAKEYVAGFEKQSHVDDVDPGAPAWAVILRGMQERLPISRRHWHDVKDVGSAGKHEL